MLTAPFQRYLEQTLSKEYNRPFKIKRISPISGGSINSCCKIDTTSGELFLKTNEAFSYPKMFQKEARGLEILRSTETIAIPNVVLEGEFEDLAFLMLEYVSSIAQAKNFWTDFGTRLAELHSNTAGFYGFDEDNFIGSLNQSNRQHRNWFDFFVTERIEKQLSLAIQSQKMDESDSKLFVNLFSKLETIIPGEVPALLHGDLWSGNFLAGNDGKVVLIDPAVYDGHREMDLAMTHLFGSYDPSFYEAYHARFPLSDGFSDRIKVHQLYPLLVHVNLFGGSYIRDVRTILKHYV